jgi:hypothetical protein
VNGFVFEACPQTSNVRFESSFMINQNLIGFMRCVEISFPKSKLNHVVNE